MNLITSTHVFECLRNALLCGRVRLEFACAEELGRQHERIVNAQAEQEEGDIRVEVVVEKISAHPVQIAAEPCIDALID